MFFAIKLSIKLDRQEIKKIPHILEEIISWIILWNFYEIGLNPEELKFWDYALIITFFKENRSWGLSNFLSNFQMLHKNLMKYQIHYIPCIRGNSSRFGHAMWELFPGYPKSIILTQFFYFHIITFLLLFTS